MFEHKGRLVAAHLKHAARTLSACFRVTETGIKEACVMNTELAYHSKVGGHFSGIVRRDCHGLSAYQDVECAWIEDDPRVTGADLLPEFTRRVMPDLIEVDYAGMGLGAITDEASRGGF